MKNLIYGLILVLAGLIPGQPETAFGQNDKTSAKSKPPTLIRYSKQKKNKISHKRKKTYLRRKVDMSKVPRLIRPAQ